jgi:hypothetical protein
MIRQFDACAEYVYLPDSMFPAKCSDLALLSQLQGPRSRRCYVDVLMFQIVGYYPK